MCSSTVQYYVQSLARYTNAPSTPQPKSAFSAIKFFQLLAPRDVPSIASEEKSVECLARTRWKVPSTPDTLVIRVEGALGSEQVVGEGKTCRQF